VAGYGEHGNEPPEFHARRGVSCLNNRTASLSMGILLHVVSCTYKIFTDIYIYT
jgi:hypothetical protein